MNGGMRRYIGVRVLNLTCRVGDDLLFVVVTGSIVKPWFLCASYWFHRLCSLQQIT